MSHLNKLRIGISIVALAIALLHILVPSLKVDAITLGLIVLAVLPWLAPLVKSVELPGGVKIELQDVERAAAQSRGAGLLTPGPEVTKPEHSFLLVAQQDPNLALAGFRIEIERRLIRLANAKGIEVKHASIRQLLQALNQHKVLTPEQLEALANLTSLLNSAVHGAPVAPAAASEAMAIAPDLLESLDRLINPTGSKVFVQGNEPRFALDDDLWVY